ncbi:MAG: glycosyltransferase [Deltaproteobacteria bacterium]|nr:glycosyltransferase [Deltaproteobacteria bacterium]
MRIDQFVHTLNYGDAISNEALTIQRLLRAQGIASDIYVIHAHEQVKQYVRYWATNRDEILAGKDSQQAIILHYSIASPLNAAFSDLRQLKRVLVFHNLTPAHWFLSYNDRVVKDLEVGFSELPRLLPQADLLLADSAYNKKELLAFGAKDVNVLPLPLDSQKWSVAANAGIAAALRDHGGKNILHVGRLAPNKCIEDIIKAFYFYHHKIEKKSKLWLIGIDIDTEIYSFELRRLVSELRLEGDVEFVGAVADCELRAFYENSDLYLCTSEHEGFCVPLLEAMYFALPVIAYDACAVGETLGDGGVLIDHKRPAEIAEIMNLLLADNSLRAGLLTAAKARAVEFGLEKFEKLLQSELIRKLWS